MLLQSLVRARLATQTLKVHVRREESSIERFQTAIRGALKCKVFEEQYAETQDAGEGVEYLEAALRGMLQRPHSGLSANYTSLGSGKSKNN